MGQTMAQKILARAAGKISVEPGEYVTVSPDYTCGHEIFWLMNRRNMDKIGVDRFARPDKVVMVIDHTTQAALGSAYHEAHKSLRDFAKRTGFENFFGAGTGLRHLVLAERGFARPGLLIFSDEGNIATIGVFGALNVHLSWEVLATLVADENWVLVPRTIRIDLDGALGFGVLPRDLVQVVNRDFATTDIMAQGCVEYAGPAIASLSLDDRQSILAGAYHAGADTAIMAVDAKALAYVEARAHGRPYQTVASDPDAPYAHRSRYDLSALTPKVTVPPEMASVVDVGDVAGLAVDQATIGSCAANRLDDLRAAAQVLKGRKVAKHVTMYISPGSQEVIAGAAREGLLEIFAEAGATVLGPGCNTCWGYLGALNDGEVSISTHQHNYHGRNGSREAKVYLGSPFVVAASAVAGKIVDPRQVLAERR
jgi:3-isopropylmalate/(R)-2-methylmalate dehydratase large subunit